MSQVVINDVSLEFDMADYDFQVKYKAAFDKMGETEKELQKIGSVPDMTKEYCQMFYTLFDDLFGAGTGEKLFCGKYNTVAVENAYIEFLNAVDAQVKEINAHRLKAANKYRPKKR